MKFVTSFIVGLALCTQIPFAQANTSEESFRLQLGAIAEYLRHTYDTTYSPLSTAEVRQVVLDSARWIVNSQETNGHFRYEYLPFEADYRNDDNMVRQAGTLFILSEIYKSQADKDATIAATIERAIGYFETLHQTGESEEGDFWCIRNSEKSIKCDLGTTALALIGVINFVTAEPEKEKVYAQTINKFTAYLKAAKFPERGFSGNYIEDDGFSKTESAYYNGEAMLALVRYYQYRKDETVRKILNDAFWYFDGQETFDSPLYLWVMAAVKDMHRLWPNDSYVRYVIDFTAWRLETAERNHGTTHNYCALVEGLTSAYSVIAPAGSPAFRERLRKEIDYWLSKERGLQLNETMPYKVVVSDGQLRLVQLPVSAQAHGGFLTGHNELTQRIDFTQHCASSYLQRLVDIDGATL